jgi:hypothetical protein
MRSTPAWPKKMAGTRLREPPAKQGLFQMLQQIRAPLRVGNKNNRNIFEIPDN